MISRLYKVDLVTGDMARLFPHDPNRVVDPEKPDNPPQGLLMLCDLTPEESAQLPAGAVMRVSVVEERANAGSAPGVFTFVTSEKS